MSDIAKRLRGFSSCSFVQEIADEITRLTAERDKLRERLQVEKALLKEERTDITRLTACVNNLLAERNALVLKQQGQEP